LQYLGRLVLRAKILNLRQKGLVSCVVFFATLIVLLISLTPAVFPALLLRSLGGFEDSIGISPFEIGVWAFPLLIANFILLGLCILYVKNKLPQPITNSFKFIFNFEVSSSVAFFVLTILIGSYIIFSVGELFDGKFQADFTLHFKPWLEDYSVTQVGVTPIGYHIQFFFETASMELFDNYKVIPFIASIALLISTYFITAEISKKKFAGIVAMVIVLQSNVFLMYDTSVSYPNFWILFYVLSLYLILKKWPLSPVSYIASVFSKPMTAAFLPMTLFFIYRADIPKKNKKYIVISYGVIAALGIIFLTILNQSFVSGSIEFYSHDFWGGFASMYTSFRFDGLVLVFILPLTIGLFFASRRGIVHADSILFLIFGMLMAPPLMAGFSDVINVPYRFVPLVVFFAMGVGVLLSKNFNEQS